MRIADVFPELEKAIIENKQISCSRQQRNGRVRWTIVIEDPATSQAFQNRMTAFLDRFAPDREGLPCP